MLSHLSPPTRHARCTLPQCVARKQKQRARLVDINIAAAGRVLRDDLKAPARRRVMVDLPTRVPHVIVLLQPAVRRNALLHSVRRAPLPDTSRCWQDLRAPAAANPTLIGRAAPICESLANTVADIIVLPSTHGRDATGTVHHTSLILWGVVLLDRLPRYAVSHRGVRGTTRSYTHSSQSPIAARRTVHHTSRV